jgi:hypothetical protein
MEHCKCGRDLSPMRKNPHNLRKHLMRCKKSDQVFDKDKKLFDNSYFQKEEIQCHE